MKLTKLEKMKSKPEIKAGASLINASNAKDVSAEVIIYQR